MAKIEELAQENAALKEGTAHGTLRQIYNDPHTSQANRIRAAQAALACEQPRLMPVQQLELKAQEEPPPEPLADLVKRGRARLDRILALPLEERSELFAPDRKGDDGNGSSD